MQLDPYKMASGVFRHGKVLDPRSARRQHHQPIDADPQAPARGKPVLQRTHVVLVDAVGLHVTGGREPGLGLEAGALVDRVVELAERVGDLAALDEQLEAIDEPRVAAGDHGRVDDGRRGQLVDEALDHECVARRAHAAPERGRNAGRLLAHILDMVVGQFVRQLDGAVDRVDIDAVLEQCREGPRHDRGADDAVVPGDDLTAVVEAGDPPVSAAMRLCLEEVGGRIRGANDE